MTVGEMIDALGRYDRDQFLEVTLHSAAHPDGAQVLIQGVKERPPWHPGPNIVGIVAHAENRELSPPRPTVMSVSEWKLPRRRTAGAPPAFDEVTLEARPIPFGSSAQLSPLVSKIIRDANAEAFGWTKVVDINGQGGFLFPPPDDADTPHVVEAK